MARHTHNNDGLQPMILAYCVVTLRKKVSHRIFNTAQNFLLVLLALHPKSLAGVQACCDLVALLFSTAISEYKTGATLISNTKFGGKEAPLF